jgi:V/A-type H+-transporting ATPase subunit D
MAKIKLTKGELKRQRDALAQYERYLPTLQLKKKQLQVEILRQIVLREEKERLALKKKEAIEVWAGLLVEPDAFKREWVKPKETIVSTKNIAGIDIPIFEKTEFEAVEYDLFTAPLWVDNALEALKTLVALQEEIKVIQRSINILRRELRVTTQRVNLFEKVKIPEAQEAIRLIKIYLGDQMTNAVGRCKIAKNKIEKALEEEAFV